jgi:hypothetical protein
MTNPKAVWYWADGDQRAGPVTPEELRGLVRQHRITPDTLIWRPGMPQWSEARRAKGLFGPPAENKPSRPSLTSHSDSPASTTPRRDETFGLIAVLLPLAGSGLIWLWVGEMSLVRNPEASLSLVGFATIGLTSLLIGVESARLGMGSPGDVDRNGRQRRNGPVNWAVFTLFLFVIGLPAYMAIRSRYGVRNYLAIAILSTLCFIASWVYVASKIG